MNFSNQNTIILAAIVVLAIGQAVLFYQLATSSSGSETLSIEENEFVAPSANGSDEGESLESLESRTVAGVVSARGSRVVTIRTPEGDSEFRIASDTEIVLARHKTDEEIHAGVDAYNARLAELMQDPEQHWVELESMMPPSTVEETPIQLSDVEIGQTIDISLNANGDVIKVSVRTE